tara:strand:- start:119 stop:922 length:804 start_codon:yes stop_codon:yes gene_type:complete
MGAVDSFIAYKFIKLMTTPWEESEAYQLGIVDKNGKILKKRKDLQTSQEKASYTILHTLVWNLKKILAKIPAGRTRLGSFAAALYLLKEKHNEQLTDKTLFERAMVWYLEDSGYEVEDRFMFHEESESLDFIERGTYVIDEQKIILTQPIPSFTTYLGESLFNFGNTCLLEDDFIPLSRYNLMEKKNRIKIYDESTFAGMPVYKVSADEYAQSINGRVKFQRWSNHLNMENETNNTIKKYAHKNPGQPVLIQNEKTGEMAYLIHRSS